jgi:hypothetical protein
MAAVGLTVADLYYADGPWVEVDHNFEIVSEDVEPDLDAFKAHEVATVTAGDVLQRHGVYSAFLASLTLSDAHRDALSQRKLSPEEIDRRQYRSLDAPAVNQAVAKLREAYEAEALLRVPGFGTCDGQVVFLQARLQGFLVPVRTLGGHIQALQVRLDAGDRKYLWISSAGSNGPSPGSPCHAPVGITTPVRDLRVTEGALKADVAFALSGMPTVGVAGVGNWKTVLDVLKQAGAENVHIAFDRDGHKGTYAAAEALAFRLAEMHFHVLGEVWDEI